ncbi:hypothetical protein L6452_29572 [Arctium lappa]|uniref:Uncharacterized protein n=1 Tax=Arctium lappa TaxID=4217 RepID=A0ACB8ZGW2_ARCLA|nr:hypothetical protein L6452_29572 [Arctium lappa]
MSKKDGFFRLGLGTKGFDLEEKQQRGVRGVNLDKEVTWLCSNSVVGYLRPTLGHEDFLTSKNNLAFKFCGGVRTDLRYRYLMLNLASILLHCKKDNKVESKATKGATLNDLVELKRSTKASQDVDRNVKYLAVLALFTAIDDPYEPPLNCEINIEQRMDFSRHHPKWLDT